MQETLLAEINFKLIEKSTGRSMPPGGTGGYPVPSRDPKVGAGFTDIQEPPCAITVSDAVIDWKAGALGCGRPRA